MPEKQAIVAENAPAAIGPYSAALSVGDFVHLSGQLGLDPQSGELVEGCCGCQTKQALRNATAVLEAAGLTLADVVKTTVFLANMDDFQKMNTAYAEFFSEPYPARSAIGVAALPRGAMVEIEVVAVRR
jgi:2-iminobutanoate/2-iminopropanoate deaminase